MIDIDKLVEVVSGEKVNPDKYGFSRTIEFSFLGSSYSIEWYANMGTLTIGDKYSTYIWFDDAKIDRCFPSYARGISFEYKGVSVCHVAEKRLDWQDKEILEALK